MPSYDVVIIGGGASGLFCALTAGRRGRSVVVLDHADKIGKKILISGGGRCNFTNREVSAANYLSANPHFCKSALARFTPDDFIAMIERHGIAYHERKHGQLFCDDSAKQIVTMLLAECAEAGVEIRSGCRIERLEKTERWLVRTSLGEFDSERVVVATGGLSLPTIGATDFGYRIAHQFGLAMVATEPALVPFTMPATSGVSELSGVAVDAVVSGGGAEFQENLLFTHHGLSGPAILQVSSYWQSGEAISIDLLPGLDLSEQLNTAKKTGVTMLLSNWLSQRLPRRLVLTCGDRLPLDRPVVKLTNPEITAIATAFHTWTVVPSGTEGYRKAEVTRGGVSTVELSSQTMEARRISGLHFIGEVVDVTGWLGGYNFQWAWASGHAAGMAM